MWKTIPGYPDYDITEYGEIRDNRNDRILPQFNDKDGYKWSYLESSTTKCKENPTLPVRDFRKEEDIV